MLAETMVLTIRAYPVSVAKMCRHLVGIQLELLIRLKRLAFLVAQRMGGW
jgi:hypothetical protein